MTKFAIGIDIGGTHISGAIVNQKGIIKTKKKITFIKPPNSKQGIRLIKQIVWELRIGNCELGIVNSPFAIGVACPGSINFNKGIVLADSPNLIGWKGTNLKKHLERVFKLPVLIDNDANLAAWGEKMWGAGKNAKNLICLTIGTGIGGGIIINNEIYRGSNFYAGEIGHMKIKPDGPLCSCGNRGCLEALVSAPAIVREFINSNPPNSPFSANPSRTDGSGRRLPTPGGNKKGKEDLITAKTVLDAARRGNKIARKVVYQTDCYLGYAIASLINIFDPEIIVLGGGVARAGNILFQPIRNIVKANIMPHPLRDVRIVTAKLGENAGLLGAAALVFDTIKKCKR